jgi:hypothetical protein
LPAGLIDSREREREFYVDRQRWIEMERNRSQQIARHMEMERELNVDRDREIYKKERST